MARNLFLICVVPLLLLGGCKSLAGDGIDTDTGPETDGGCGSVDILCCASSPYCDEDLACVVGAVSAAPDDGYCLSLCTPPLCTNEGGYEGTCTEVGLAPGSGVCLADEDFEPVDCQASTTDCTTPGGVSTGTICLTNGDDNYCFEMCTIEEDECDDEHTCLPTSDGSGACIFD